MQDGVVLANAVWTIGRLLLAVVLPSLGTWQEALSASKTYTYADYSDDTDDDDNDDNGHPYECYN